MITKILEKVTNHLEYEDMTGIEFIGDKVKITGKFHMDTFQQVLTLYTLEFSKAPTITVIPGDGDEMIFLLYVDLPDYGAELQFNLIR